ncbi:MAG: DUF1592 domain-containing protein [Rubripirellula sp.]
MSIYLRSFVLLPLMVLAVALQASPPSPKIQQFLRDNCVDCHTGPDADGGLDLEDLSVDLANPRLMDQWTRIFDRVDSGEMPPEDAGELDPNDAAVFLESTSSWLIETQRAEHQKLGRVRSRRLTNQQLERTLHDLLAIDVPLATLMPEEQRTDGFTNIAEGQPMSHFQLASHLTVIDAGLDAAFARLREKPAEPWRKPYNARQIARQNPNRRCRDPEMLGGQAVVWNSTMIFYGRITSSTVERSGWYRVTFTASAKNQPKDHGVWCTVRSGRCTSGAPLLSWIGSFEATDKPTEHTFEAWLPEGHMLEIRPADATLKRARFQGGQVGAGEGAPQKVPGLALHKMQVEQFHPGGDISLVKKRLLGDMQVKFDRKRSVQSISDQPAQDAAKQLRAFTRRAFRRPVTEQQLRPYLQLLHGEIESGVDPLEALRSSYRAVLCSPRFLYLVEPAGPLDDHAIASRLSYLFTGSMPDHQLAKLARQGQLRDPQVLHEQVERLLKDNHLRQFVKDFSAEWLDLVDIDFTEPDRKLYRDFDIVVQDSMLAETHRFLQSLLHNDLSVSNLVLADYTFLNSRLARYYDLEPVESGKTERVSLPADSHRGGLLAQGSILKVTANGTNTSPVLRGVWVSERILGTPIPPPPESVPAVEPDIRGAKTIREQLEKHLSHAECAVCHRNIDPPGYALENFDAAGQWRDNYLKVEKGRVKTGSPINSSFAFADGREFADFGEFRQMLAMNPRPIARNFAEKLIVYGTGAPISFADRAVVEEIVDQTADNQHGLRSLVHAVVKSTIFLTK